MALNEISALDIVTHTPPWVWPLLAYTLYSGWSMTRDRTVASWRVFIMPAIVAAFAVVNLVTGGKTAAELAGFAAGTVLGALAGLAIPRAHPARWLDNGRLALVGDWLPLFLLIGIFSVKYAQGVALVLAPALSDNPLFTFGGTAAPALFAALMVVRVMRALPAGVFRRRSGGSNAVKYTVPS